MLMMLARVPLPQPKRAKTTATYAYDVRISQCRTLVAKDLTADANDARLGCLPLKAFRAAAADAHDAYRNFHMRACGQRFTS